ncbi:hypothetical protein CJU93_16760, partial [Brucella melitensis]
GRSSSRSSESGPRRKNDPERCRHLSYELHDKEDSISAATIVMPRAHRKELTGLKALKGIGRDPGA